MKKHKGKLLAWFIIFNLIIFFSAYFSNFNEIRYNAFAVVSSYQRFFDKETDFLIWLLLLFAVISFLIVLMTSYKKVDTHKAKVVEDGIYGNARWANDQEVKEDYLLINKLGDKGSGWYVGEQDGKIIIDPRDRNMLVLAPPGIGKTTRFICNNIIQAVANDDMVLSTDTKEEIFTIMYPYAKKNGYECYDLNYRNPLKGNKDNPMSIINKYIDKSLLTENRNERLTYKARAQRYAKILSNSIIGTASATAGMNKYFYDVAEGIITSTILLVSEYCDEKDRHIINVLRIVAEGMEAYETEEKMTRTRMYQLMQLVDNTNKIKWFSEAGVNADIRTSMNTFSTALSNLLAFVDDEIEQMICFESDFDPETLLENPKQFTVVNVPEENPTRHFFASLKINTFNNQLLDIAAEQESKVLPFIVRLLGEEFGTLPAIKNYNNIMTAGRSRGIYSCIILQNFSQLDDKYDEKIAKVIRKACQNVIFGSLTPEQFDDAEELSKALGNQTVIAPQINRSNKPGALFNHGQIGESQQAKPLMFPDEIIRLPMDNWVMLSSGGYPLRVNTTIYLKHMKPPKNEYKYIPKDIIFNKMSYLNLERLISRIIVFNNKGKVVDQQHSNFETNNFTEVVKEENNTFSLEETELYFILNNIGKLKLLETANYNEIKKELTRLVDAGHITKPIFVKCREEMEMLVASS